jgi:hypothetical protein
MPLTIPLLTEDQSQIDNEVESLGCMYVDSTDNDITLAPTKKNFRKKMDRRRGGI